MDLFYFLDIISKIIAAALAGMICGLFSYFLDYCFWPGSIFKGYLPWLAKRVISAHNKSELELILKLPKESQENELINAAQKYFIFKPLGGCAVCSNIYIAAASYAVICYFSPFEWFYLFPYMLASSALLRKLVGATY